MSPTLLAKHTNSGCFAMMSIPFGRCAGFFMKDDPVHQTLRKITTKLDELAIPYASVAWRSARTSSCGQPFR
jgi:hypothetical protein